MRLRQGRAYVKARSAFAAIGIAVALAVAPGIATADPATSVAAGGGAGTFGTGLAGTVDTSSGAAVMSVPLELPTARGIAQPDISLSYNAHDPSSHLRCARRRMGLAHERSDYGLRSRW